MNESTTIAELLANGADDAVALAAPDRPPLRYADLRAQAHETVAALNRFGVGRGQRVAMVLPNGPEMAAAFLCVGAGATAAPLNPAYRGDEFAFYLEDLDAAALLLPAGSDSPAREAASRLDVPVIELAAVDGGGAGRFVLSVAGIGNVAAPAAGGIGEGGLAAGDMAAADDAALVLHTSGTTSRPKIVPLTQANICASAHHICTTLRLTAEDRCLNVMPLFHIHGLMAALLATIGAGGSVFCTPGFNALKFFAWLQEASPTWFTAVPTMYQAILARAPRNTDAIERSALRFMRSSSASLPVAVLGAAERVFGAPLVEAYAMTEAAHQMTCNPLPPRQRKPGTVGPAAGPEVAIMSAGGELLGRDSVGEIVIRGANVTCGYENNPEANAAGFTDGWFRTGDQGVLDGDGYLTITGRLKEIINRGGEKVSPLEIDAVIMEHPGVQQVVTFAVPHDKLGEDVGAAVVPADATDVDGNEVREFCRRRLADFKVPRIVVIVDEIPKGPTGKMQRIGMAERLGLVEP